MNLLAKRSLLSLAAVACLAGLGAVNGGDKPKLTFKDAGSTKTVTLADYKGKVVAGDFWATWCGPCMNEAGHMVELSKKYADKGVQFVGISLDKVKAKMLKVAKEKGFAWPQQFDGKVSKNAVAVEWGVNSIPQTFVISPEGEVLWRGHPAELDSHLEEAAAKVTAVSSDAPTTKPSTPAK
jgi:thiol-disulfide isomerase/thioredoxin